MTPTATLVADSPERSGAIVAAARAGMLLSLGAKTLSAWQVFACTVRP
jgi:hypothetical protein